MTGKKYSWYEAGKQLAGFELVEVIYAARADERPFGVSCYSNGTQEIYCMANPASPAFGGILSDSLDALLQGAEVIGRSSTFNSTENALMKANK